MARPTHIYASAFSRRERSLRRLRRRFSRSAPAALPAALGAATGAVLVGVAEIAPQIVGTLL